MTSICLLLLPRSSCLFNKLFSAGSQGKKKQSSICVPLFFFGMAEVTKTSFPSAMLNIALYKTSRCVTNPLGFLGGLGTECQQHSCGVCAPSWKGKVPSTQMRKKKPNIFGFDQKYPLPACLPLWDTRDAPDHPLGLSSSPGRCGRRIDLFLQLVSGER